MVANRNGDLYVALMTSGGRGQPETGGGAVALRDANNDGKFEVVERFASGSTTGIAIRNGYVYLAHPTVIERYKLTDGHAEAHRRGRDDRHRTAHGAPARGQGHRLRRPRRPLYQRRRAVERLPGSGSAARCQGRGPLPDSREARRHLEVRREQDEPDAGPGHALRHRPAPDAGHHVARRRALRRDEQPRSARRLLAGPVHRQGQRRASRRAALSRGAGIELRVAVLLLRLHDEDDDAQPGVRRRRQDGRAAAARSRRRRRRSRRTGPRWT